MIQENEIRNVLLRYLSGDQSLDALEDWLVQSSWNMHRDSDIASQRLASKIELALAEFNAGHISEPILRRQLRLLASTYEVSFVPNSDAEAISYTSNSTVQIPRAGMRVSEVFVS
jgi:hypothetical protein